VVFFHNISRPFYRKGKIFKSRAARATPPPLPKPAESTEDAFELFAAPEEPTEARRNHPEPPPRVPPVSRHFVELGNGSEGKEEVKDVSSVLSPEKKAETKVGKVYFFYPRLF